MNEQLYPDSKFLIVDDQEHNVDLLERILKRAGYNHYKSTLYPREFLNLFDQFDPDIVLMDLHMPELDGFEILEELSKRIPESHFVPIIVLTADVTPEAKKRALSLGAHDFLTKPFDRVEVLLRIRNLLKTRFLHLEIQNQNQILELKVAERTKELELAQKEILSTLAKASEFRDDITGGHTKRVGEMSAMVAASLGMDDDRVEIIRYASPLHDIGKIGISDEILLKPGKFTIDEFERMKLHTWIGSNIVADSFFPILQAAQAIALTHHERWDGTGYPNALSGEQIPIEGRIVAIVDFYDALVNERPYKKGWSAEDAINEIKNQSGKHFDPVVVEAFLSLIRYDENGPYFPLPSDS